MFIYIEVLYRNIHNIISIFIMLNIILVKTHKLTVFFFLTEYAYLNKVMRNSTVSQMTKYNCNMYLNYYHKYF